MRQWRPNKIMGTHTGRLIGSRRGMTLLELLVAMMVLMVGIYTIAKGFPSLLNAIRGEGDRTVMARLAEVELQRYARDPHGLPDAVTGGGSISAYDAPEDLTEPTRPVNVEENVLDVIGESFRVPAAYIPPGGSYAAGTSSQYVLRQGPAAWTDPNGTDGMPYVYLLIPLTEQMDDPEEEGSAGLARNHFFVDAASGDLLAPPTAHTYDGDDRRDWSVDEIVVDYGWAEAAPLGARPRLHYVQGETVNDISGTDPLVCKVHAAHLQPSMTTFGQIVPGQTRAWAKHYFVREDFGVSYPDRPGHYVLENNYGVTLRFHPQDTGLTLKVDYRLKADDADRRLLLMSEEQRVDANRQRVDGGGIPFTDIRLALRTLDDGMDFGKTFSTDTRSNPLPTNLETNVLAVDAQTGNVYQEGAPFTLTALDLQPSLENGYRDGLITLPIEISGATAPYVGHTLRFFYRTLDRHNLQLQKAPRSFVDRQTAESYQTACIGHLGPQAEAASLAEVDYRTYDLTYRRAGNVRLGVLEFGQWLDEDLDPSSAPIWSEARNTAGMTIAVNYMYWTGNPAQQRTVWGELHTLPTTGTTISLNSATLADDGSTSWDDYPIVILAVNGVSARMRAWWLNDLGRQRRADIESCFLPTALGLLPRVR